MKTILTFILSITVMAGISQDQDSVWAQIDREVEEELVKEQPKITVPPAIDTIRLTEEEEKLVQLINKYRKSKGLEPVEVSKSLTYVARVHVYDLEANGKKIKKGCNMHSWSKKFASKYGYTPVDYFPDHRNSEGLWNKPKELTPYKGNGYENAFWDSEGATAKDALQGWKTSPGHNSVIINSKDWTGIKWKSMGVAIYGKYAVVWFGEEADPAGYIKIN